MPFFSWKSKNRMTVQSAANDFPFCCKRFFNLLRTIFGRTDICLTNSSILKTLSGKNMGVRGMSLPCPTSHKLFFSRKGSLPSDLFCTNTLRWTFYRTILHRDFTEIWYAAYRFRFTNVNHLVINRVMVKDLTKAFSCCIFANKKTPKTQILWTSKRLHAPP